MVVDAFKDHFTGYVAEPMLIGHTDVLKVPAGRTSRVHSLDVCQQTLQIYPKGVWEGHVVKMVKETVEGANNNRRFKLSSPTTQDFVNWVHR